MERVDISAWPRTELGKGPSGRLRKEGLIPATLYGPGVKENLSLQLKNRDVEKVIHAGQGGNVIINLNVEGVKAPTTVMFKKLDRHPVKDTIEHIDLIGVLMDKTVVVDVPLHITGKCKGVFLGGILQHELRSIHVECLPDSIPTAIDVDVTDLDIGESVHVSDLKLPENISVTTDESLTVAIVAAPRVEKVEEEAAEGEEGEEAAAAEEGSEEKAE